MRVNRTWAIARAAQPYAHAADEATAVQPWMLGRRTHPVRSASGADERRGGERSILTGDPTAALPFCFMCAADCHPASLPSTTF
jgi:hypothetical protein